MEERKGFKSTFGFLMAAVGSAVGLGNIWGFPNKMGSNGGFAFLLVYFVLAVLCGYIVMVGELAIGRKTGKSAIATYQTLSRKFKWLGWLATASPFLILSFYCALGGYCIKYLVLNVGNLFGAGFGTNGLSGGAVFESFMLNQTEGVIFGLIFVALTMLIVLGGVAGGIEKVCAIGMPCLFVALLICIIRAITLPGAVDGLKYMFVPGWAVAQGIVEQPNFFSVLSTAGGQMFFSLSLGMGAMITYGSYLDKKQNLEKNAIMIVVLDTLVALMAGLCVIPARFALDPTGALGGPSLLFVTMQNVFGAMGAIGPVFGILFYVLVVFAAISSSISLLEVIVTHFVDKAAEKGKGDKRKKYTLVAAVCVGIGCILVCADRLGMAGIHPAALLGLENYGAWAADWLDFFDMLSEGIMMPLGALLMSLMLGWETGPDLVKEECEQEGNKLVSYGFFKICVKVITPLCMLLILWGQIDSFF